MVATVTGAVFSADAQSRRPAERPLVLRVAQPRSYLDPGTVVPVGSLDRTTSGYAQTQSYLLSPPYKRRTGSALSLGVLPDPITNGPFVGSRNPLDLSI